MRKFVYEMMLSNNTAAGNDVNAAVDDVCVQAIERLIRLLLAPGSACACQALAYSVVTRSKWLIAY